MQTNATPFINARTLALGGGLLTVLCGTPSAMAQAIAPAPQPAGGAFAFPAAPNGAAAHDEPIAQPRAAVQGTPTLSLRFTDAPVADIVRMIAEQGNVQVMITGDVEQKLKYLNLEDLKPEAAIERVALAAGLGWKKLADNTYVIGAKLPVEVAKNDGPITTIPATTTTAGIVPRSFDNASVAAPTWPELVRQTGDSERAEGGERSYYQFKIKNVRASTVMWWLDPAHNQPPIEELNSIKSRQKRMNKTIARPAVDPAALQAMRGTGPAYTSAVSNYNGYGPASIGNFEDNGSYNGGGGYNQFAQPYTSVVNQFGQRGGTGGRGGAAGGRGGAAGGRGGGGGAFQLPEGIESAIAIDPQNAILIYGTEAGYRRLQNILSFLDKPLQQVEIEAQFVTLNTNDTRQIGIDFKSNNGPFTTNLTGQAPGASPGAFTLGYVRGNFQANLNALITSSRAKVVNAPRVLAINNLTASITSEVQTPVVLTSTTSGIGGQVGESQDLFYIPTNIGLEVTPTINNDGTITVVMVPEVSTSNPDVRTGQPVISSQTIETTANVRDGDTIALGGLRSQNISRGGSRIPVLSRLPILGQFFRSNARIASDNDLIIFLTAKIVHRLEENEQVPGT